MCFMKFLIMSLGIGMVLALATTARAQEPELINEIVARVNNEIITRADYLNALRDFREELGRQMTGKSVAEVDAEFERLKPTVLNYMIDDILLEQKAKELNIDCEADVNQRMKEIASQNGAANVLAFENELKKQGIDPEAARASIRKGCQQQSIIQREVLAPIYQRLNEKDKLDFYNRNKDAFKVPGEVTLSEIFLPLEGHTASEVDQRAKRLVAELRAGKAFAVAVQENSPVGRASRAQNGKLGTFKQGELKEDLAAAISTLKPGDVTERIRLQDGFQIIRLDDQKEAKLRKFEDADVQNAIGRAATMERADDARKKYLQRLRQDAFGKISASYD